MATTPVILKVARFEDGVVQQTVVEDGIISETYFKPREMGISEFELEHVSRLTGFFGVHADREAGTDCVSPTPSQVRVESKLWAFTISILIDILLVVYAAWIVNPFWIDGILQTPTLGDPSQVPRRVLDQRLGCQAESFCWAYSPPTVSTPAGTFFPNFTSDAGATVNYTAVLTRALSIMANESCGGYTVISSSGAAISGSERLSPSFDSTRYAMQWATLMLSFECHPEIALALATPDLFRHWGEIDFQHILPDPTPGPCRQNWSDLFSTTVVRTRKTTLCSGRVISNDATVADSGDFLIFK